MKPVMILMMNEAGDVFWQQPEGANIGPAQMATALTMFQVMVHNGFVQMMMAVPGKPMISTADPALVAKLRERNNGLR